MPNNNIGNMKNPFFIITGCYLLYCYLCLFSSSRKDVMCDVIAMMQLQPQSIQPNYQVDVRSVKLRQEAEEDERWSELCIVS